MQGLTKTLLTTLALAIPLYAAASPAWFNRTFVKADGYVPIADDVYADPRLTADQRQRSLAALQAARARIADLYGAPRARPLTIITADAQEAARFGLIAGQPGAAFLSLAAPQVVLNMAQFSLDVTAHELMHAEVADRLGLLARLTRLPVWFDEGLSMQLDWRKPYLIDCAAVGRQRIDNVQTLYLAAQFLEGDKKRIVGNYEAAKCAAAQVLQRHPPATLYAALTRLRHGESFHDVFLAGVDGIE